MMDRGIGISPLAIEGGDSSGQSPRTSEPHFLLYKIRSMAAMMVRLSSM